MTSKILWVFLGLSGRINRQVYLLGGLFVNILPAFLLYRFMIATPETPEASSWAMLFSFGGIAAIWSIVSLSVKRLHDFDKPGLLAVALVVPFLSILAFVVLCIIPGDNGPNRYAPATNLPN